MKKFLTFALRIGSICLVLSAQAYMSEGGRTEARLNLVTGQWATWYQIIFFQDLNDAKGLIVRHLIGPY